MSTTTKEVDFAKLIDDVETMLLGRATNYGAEYVSETLDLEQYADNIMPGKELLAKVNAKLQDKKGYHLSKAEKHKVLEQLETLIDTDIWLAVSMKASIRLFRENLER